jgi:hypothetical protein
MQANSLLPLVQRERVRADCASSLIELIRCWQPAGLTGLPPERGEGTNRRIESPAALLSQGNRLDEHLPEIVPD